MRLEDARVTAAGRITHDGHAMLDPVGIIERTFEQFDCTSVLTSLRALGDEVYLVGGSVRDGLSGMSGPRDIDLMVPNASVEVHDIIGRLGPSRRNRHGNWRYLVSEGFHIDVIEPRFFYGRFSGARDALAFFDTSVNAVGIRLHDGCMLDPLGGVSDLSRAQVTLPRDRWATMSDFESVHLVLRLVRLLSRMPLRVTNPEVALVHLSKFDLVDWSELERLNGLSRAQAEQRVEYLLGASYHQPDSARAIRRAWTQGLLSDVPVVDGPKYPDSALAPMVV